jgi:S-adenosyl-L-methionine hydrolase (adenosine-forming)
MARPVIALLTDFGTTNHYAGTMKGVVLGICPDVTLVDIAHDLPPHDVVAGALELAAAYRYFPAATIFLVVVDPGVGSSRRALAVEAGEYRFVGPDNGVLSAALKETPPRKIVELTARKYARPTISRTFEGRDRFAPAAAWLAKGVALASLGQTHTDYHRLDLPDPVVTATDVSGVVITIDRFGNAITNIDRRSFERVAAGGVRLTAGSHEIGRVVATYSEASPDEACALFGSTDRLEVAVPGASAAERLGLARGSSVKIVRLS